MMQHSERTFKNREKGKKGGTIRVQMTKEEKEELVERITNMLMQDVLLREDAIEIMRICKEACERRISEIEREIKPEGPIQ